MPLEGTWPCGCPGCDPGGKDSVANFVDKVRNDRYDDSHFFSCAELVGSGTPRAAGEKVRSSCFYGYVGALPLKLFFNDIKESDSLHES